MCAECGAAVVPDQPRCWLCKSDRVGPASLNPYASPLPTQDNLAWQFSLSSLFLITTLIAVCLGVTLMLPGLGVLLWIFAVPALVRTIIDIRKHKQRGAALGAMGKMGSFVVSILVVGLVAFASFIAAFTVCLVGVGVLQGSSNRMWNEVIPFVFLGLILAAVLAAATWTFWILRPRD